MLKVLMVSPFFRDANSFFRCMGPWNYLARKSRTPVPGKPIDADYVEITQAGDDVGISGIGWDTVSQFDMVFMHRPCREDDLIVLKNCKNSGIPVWVDYDDWLFDVPFWNPTVNVYNNAGMQNIIATCMACADVVSVSTSALYDRLRAVNENVVILPNMYQRQLYPYRQDVPPARASQFAWRGSNTHDADLMSVGDGFKKLPAKVMFYGGPSWVVLSQMPPDSHLIVPSQDPFLYMRQIYQNAPKVLLFPLVDCFFNRAKSNIAYQEALHAGAICVAPDMPEWCRPGVVTYKPSDPVDFARAAEQAFATPEDEHAKIVADAYAHMQELYGAPNVNRIREQVLAAVFAPDFKKNERDVFDPLVGMWALGQLKGIRAVAEVSEAALQKAGIA